MADNTDTPILSNTALNAPAFITGGAQLLSSIIVVFAARHYGLTLSLGDVVVVVLPALAFVNTIVGGLASRLAKAHFNPANLASSNAVKVATQLPITQEAASVNIPATPSQK